MRFFIELAYKGTNFHGWQRQPNAHTVQSEIEEALFKLLRERVEIVGCGRTDTGVHSSSYVAHFEYDGTKELNQDFIYQLNSCLSRDIVMFNIYKCDKHARFDALEREYQYFISRYKNPFAQQLSWQLTVPLDEQSMQVAADKLLQYSDFSAFEKLHSDNKTSICRITKAEWSFTEKEYCFTIVADRFLRGMVRMIVGTLVDVGRGKITPEDFAAIIESGNVARASAAAPADGLYLTHI